MIQRYEPDTERRKPYAPSAAALAVRGIRRYDNGVYYQRSGGAYIRCGYTGAFRCYLRNHAVVHSALQEGSGKARQSARNYA